MNWKRYRIGLLSLMFIVFLIGWIGHWYRNPFDSWLVVLLWLSPLSLMVFERPYYLIRGTCLRKRLAAHTFKAVGVRTIPDSRPAAKP